MNFNFYAIQYAPIKLSPNTVQHKLLARQNFGKSFLSKLWQGKLQQFTYSSEMCEVENCWLICPQIIFLKNSFMSQTFVQGILANCTYYTYHSNSVLYGTVGVLMTQIKVRLALWQYFQCWHLYCQRGDSQQLLVRSFSSKNVSNFQSWPKESSRDKCALAVVI